MKNKEWFNYTIEDLADKERQAEVFRHMLRRLEDDGHCRYVFHSLAHVLFQDEMEG